MTKLEIKHGKVVNYFSILDAVLHAKEYDVLKEMIENAKPTECKAIVSYLVSHASMNAFVTLTRITGPNKAVVVESLQTKTLEARDNDLPYMRRGEESIVINLAKPTFANLTKEVLKAENVDLATSFASAFNVDTKPFETMIEKVGTPTQLAIFRNTVNPENSPAHHLDEMQTL